MPKARCQKCSCEFFYFFSSIDREKNFCYGCNVTPSARSAPWPHGTSDHVRVNQDLSKMYEELDHDFRADGQKLVNTIEEYIRSTTITDLNDLEHLHCIFGDDVPWPAEEPHNTKIVETARKLVRGYSIVMPRMEQEMTQKISRRIEPLRRLARTIFLAKIIRADIDDSFTSNWNECVAFLTKKPDDTPATNPLAFKPFRNPHAVRTITTGLVHGESGRFHIGQKIFVPSSGGKSRHPVEQRMYPEEVKSTYSKHAPTTAVCFDTTEPANNILPELVGSWAANRLKTGILLPYSREYALLNRAFVSDADTYQRHYDDPGYVPTGHMFPSVEELLNHVRTIGTRDRYTEVLARLHWSTHIPSSGNHPCILIHGDRHNDTFRTSILLAFIRAYDLYFCFLRKKIAPIPATPIRMCVYIPKRRIDFTHDDGRPFLMTDDLEFYFRKYHIAPLSAADISLSKYYATLSRIFHIQRLTYQKLLRTAPTEDFNNCNVLYMLYGTGQLSKATYSETKLAVWKAFRLAGNTRACPKCGCEFFFSIDGPTYQSCYGCWISLPHGNAHGTAEHDRINQELSEHNERFLKDYLAENYKIIENFDRYLYSTTAADLDDLKYCNYIFDSRIDYSSVREAKNQALLELIKNIERQCICNMPSLEAELAHKTAERIARLSR